MGVLGLTPFLQKTCPEVIKHLPDRLKGFSGKRIVFDGTLITQRFHFAHLPHPYRHVLGWYRMVKELEAYGVEAVCVFDGKERTAAKALETLRRKETQKLQAARGVIEKERLSRLKQLGGVVGQLAKLSPTEKARVSDVLGRRRAPSKDAEEVPEDRTRSDLSLDPFWNTCGVDFPSDQDVSRYMDDWYAGLQKGFSSEPPVSDVEVTLQEESFSAIDSVFGEEPLPSQPPAEELPSGHEDTSVLEASVVQKELETTTTAPSPTPVMPSIPSSIAETRPLPIDKLAQDLEKTALVSSEKVLRDEPTPSDVEQITAILAPLYLEYRSSVPKIASIPPSSQAASGAIDNTADDVAKVEYEMSKRQYQLTLEEGKFWEALTSTLDSVAPVDSEAPVTLDEGQQAEQTAPSHEEVLSLLAHESALISESYARRPPTTQTYNESKEVLRALGVPVVEPSGPFEAEALASSLVLNGYADYVASEDTDVLIYEVPLLRNMTSRNQPLTIVSGADIRSILQLSKSMFIDFALLLGTDFSQRIKNVGPARALKFIREYGSIENIIEAETKYPPRLPPEDYLKQVDAGRSVYRTLPPVPVEDGLLKQKKADEEQILYVMGKYGLSREVEWNWEAGLEGNYFDDNSSGI